MADRLPLSARLATEAYGAPRDAFGIPESNSGSTRECYWCRHYEGMDHDRMCPVTIVARLEGVELVDGFVPREHGGSDSVTPIRVLESELIRAVQCAEQQLRFYMHRDEMNAEVHREPKHEGGPNVRYSPITYAAQFLVSFLHGQLHVQLYHEELPKRLVDG